jgi:hypothetical protein
VIDTKKLKKIGDILNGEGMFLGLFQNESDIFYLGSHLIDGSGDLYYSTNLETLKKYLKSEIKLRHVYMESEDFIVTRKFRNEQTSFIKDDMVELITLVNQFYSEFSSSMKNSQIEKEYNVS